MRALVFACLVALAGCIIDNDPVRVENFTAETPTTFTYDAWTNTVMTPNDDGAAEQIRRDWLAETPTAHGMCAAGYVVETRRFEQPWEGRLVMAATSSIQGVVSSAPETTARVARQPHSAARQRSISGPPSLCTGSPTGNRTAAIRGARP